MALQCWPSFVSRLLKGCLNNLDVCHRNLLGGSQAASSSSISLLVLEATLSIERCGILSRIAVVLSIKISSRIVPHSTEGTPSFLALRLRGDERGVLQRSRPCFRHHRLRRK